MSKISAIAYNSLYVNMGHYNGSSWDHYQSHKTKITPSDIYRHALSGNILLSVYFSLLWYLRRYKLLMEK